MGLSFWNSGERGEEGGGTATSRGHRGGQVRSLSLRSLSLCGLAVLFLFLLSVAPSWAKPPKLSFLIGKVARQEGVDPNLLSAVVATESQFDVASVSARGAVGLMQLMPDTARELGVVNRFNPEQNLRGGARYLRRMIERYPNNLSLALAAYNAGPAAVVRFRGVPPFPETKRYIRKVLGRYAKMVPGRNKPPRVIVTSQPERPVAARGEEKRRPVVRPVGPRQAPKVKWTVVEHAGEPKWVPVPNITMARARHARAPIVRVTRR